VQHYTLWQININSQTHTQRNSSEAFLANSLTQLRFFYVPRNIPLDVKTGDFVDVLPSRSCSMVLKELNLTERTCTRFGRTVWRLPRKQTGPILRALLNDFLQLPIADLQIHLKYTYIYSLEFIDVCDIFCEHADITAMCWESKMNTAYIHCDS